MMQIMNGIPDSFAHLAGQISFHVRYEQSVCCATSVIPA